MAPYHLITASVSLLAKSFSVFSCTSTLARGTSVLSAAYVNQVKCLSSQASGPPKKPLNGYMRYVVQQKPILARQQPELKVSETIKTIAQQWRTMDHEQKQPFIEAALEAREQFKVALQHYEAQLTPEELQQKTLDKRQRMAKRKAVRKKRELTNLGKPKRPRSAFNIFMSENFREAKGATMQVKMKTLLEDWKNLDSHDKQIYIQLHEDDKIRYKNEMKSWEDHMMEIGREDLIRGKTLSAAKLRRSERKKGTIKAKVKAMKKATAKRKSKSVSKKK